MTDIWLIFIKSKWKSKEAARYCLIVSQTRSLGFYTHARYRKNVGQIRWFNELVSDISGVY